MLVSLDSVTSMGSSLHSLDCPFCLAIGREFDDNTFRNLPVTYAHDGAKGF